MQNAEHHPYPFGPVPKRLNDFFVEKRDIVGRTDELAQVRRDLLAGRSTVLVNGIGGIGKTTIARKYVELNWDDYHHVLWLTVAAPQSIGHDPHAAAADAGYSPLRDAFLRSPALWRSLHMTEQVERCLSGKDLAGAFELLRQRLGLLERCLVVLDNANDAADLLENRPALKSMNAHVLVTSRAKPKEWNIVTVDELPLPQAVALFRQHYRHPSLAQATAADLDTLAETLLRHTLLLELVGKSASPEGANLPLPRLLESLQNRSFHAQPLNELAVDAGDHADGQNLRRQATVEEYITLIFNHISHLGTAHCELLRALTLLPPATAYGRDFLQKICTLLGFDFEPKQAEFLAQFGWLQRVPLDEGGIGYALHPLVLDVAFRELNVTAEWASAVIDHVRDLIDYDSLDPQHNLHEKRKLQPFGEHLGKLFWEAETAAVSRLLDCWGYLEENYGFYTNAARLKERALAIAEAKLSEEIVAVRQSNLANVYRNLGEYARARDLLEAALQSDLKNFGPEHPNVAVRQSNLANVYDSLGEYARARDLLEAALQSDLKNFGPEHPTVAVSQSNLANVYDSLGEYARARDLLEAALQSDLKNFGPEHPTVAVSQSNLANVYDSLGEYARARDLLEAALQSDLKNFGPEHPNVAVRQSNLANVYRNLGEYARARDLLEAALQSAVKNFGPEHPNVAVSQSNLANVYRNLGEYARARDLLEAALQSDLKNFGPEHPNVAVRQSNLANVYDSLGEYARARDLLEAALQSAVKNFGPEHPNVAVSRNNLAHVFLSEKNYPAAVEQFEEALRVVEKSLGREHPYYQQFSESLEGARRAAASQGGSFWARLRRWLLG